MKFFITLIFSFLCEALHAQPPLRYIGSFGGVGDDIAYSGKQTLEGQYIVAGSSTRYGSTDVYLAKIDSMSGGIWDKFYGGSGDEVARSVVQLPDSGFVLAGFTNSFGAGGYDAFLLRVDKDGGQLWQRTFGGSDWDFANDLVMGPDGHLFVVGATYSSGSGKKDGFLLKYDLSGNLLAQKFVGGGEDDELRAIIVTQDNYLAMAGYTKSRGEINGDGYFVKADLNLDTLFTRSFGGPYKDFMNDLVQKDASQNFEYMFGGARTYSTANSKTHAYVYRMSASGTFLSDKDYFQNGGDEEFVSASNSRHLPQLTAFARSAVFSGYGIQGEVILTFPDGSLYKSNHFGGSKSDYAYSVEATKDGGYLTVGSTASFKSQGIDVIFMKHDSTCHFYANALSLRSEDADDGPSVSYLYNKKLHIRYPASERPVSVSVTDLTGKLVWQSKEAEVTSIVDLSPLESSVYLLQFNYPNGHRLYEKILLSD